MASLNSPLQPDDRITFLRGFLAKPREVGSIIPSSRFMERRIVRAADLRSASLAVELGPGTGGTTRALLRAMRPDAKLLVVEINPVFCDHLREKINDERLIVHHGSATDVGHALGAHGLEAPDVMLSGIPFSTMPPALGTRILHSVRDALAPGGSFIAYQFRDVVHSLGKEVFGRAEVQMELLNMPPMRVYRWTTEAERGNL